jgi:hypothetical protein
MVKSMHSSRRVFFGVNVVKLTVAAGHAPPEGWLAGLPRRRPDVHSS